MLLDFVRSGLLSSRRYRTFKDEHRLYMLMDYVSGGELFRHLRSAGCFPTATARFYIACVISAIEHLHSHDIVYRRACRRCCRNIIAWVARLQVCARPMCHCYRMLPLGGASWHVQYCSACMTWEVAPGKVEQWSRHCYEP